MLRRPRGAALHKKGEYRMNCVNCACHLTFFNETDELWGGTERALCHSCRAKIEPFLNEVCVGSHVDHLRERRAALTARGVTAEGLAHLEEYCRHLDSLTVRPKAPASVVSEPLSARKPVESPLAALRRTMREEPQESEEGATAAPPQRNDREVLDAVIRSNQVIRADIRELSSQQSDSVRILSDKLERTQEKMRLVTYLAAAGAGSGLLAFLSVLILLILR